MKFSIIIPAYNSQDFLARAIKSVIAQTFKDYELIIVNDGSTDNTKEIGENYVKNFSQVKLINKTNGGLSSARNAGMKVAKGDYLVFLDSDDKLHSSNLLSNIEKYTNSYPDVIIGNIQAVTKRNKRFLISSNLDLNIKSTDNIQQIITKYVNKNRQPPWMAFQSIVKSKFIKKNKLYFNEKTPTQEDLLYFFELAQKKCSVKVIKEILVDYTYLRAGSISNTLNYSNIANALINFSEVYDNLASNKNIKSYIADRYVDYIPPIFSLNEKDKINCMKLIRKKKYILCSVNRKNPKYCVYTVLWKMFGLENGSKLILNLKKLVGKIIKYS